MSPRCRKHRITCFTLVSTFKPPIFSSSDTSSGQHGLSYEKSKANEDGGRGVAFVLFNSIHVDCQQQNAGEERLDEQPLEDGSAGGELRLDNVCARKDEFHHDRGDHCTQDLTGGEEDSLEPSQCPYETHSQRNLDTVSERWQRDHDSTYVAVGRTVTYSRVEKPPTDSSKDGDIDGEGHSECQTDVQQLGDVDAFASTRGVRIGDLGCRKCEQKKQKGASEFSGNGNEMPAKVLVEVAENALGAIVSWHGEVWGLGR